MEQQYIQDTVLRDLGEVVLSNTQKIHVREVEDANDNNSKKVSIQKWWRKSNGDEWNLGKGFKLLPEEARQLGDILSRI